MNIRPSARRRPDAAAGAGTTGQASGWARLGVLARRQWRTVALAGAILVVAAIAFSADPTPSTVTSAPEAATSRQPGDGEEASPTGTTEPGSTPEPAAATAVTSGPSGASTPSAQRPDPYIRDFAQQPGVAPLPPQPSPTAGVDVPIAINGCDNNYGHIGQCVPLQFPASVTEKCAWLAKQGLTSIPVNGTDRHGLDPDGNGIAC